MEPKDILGYLGIDAEKTTDLNSFKENFDAEFIKKNKAVEFVKSDDALASQIYGKKVGSLETVAKSGFKSLGVEFEGDEIKGKPLEDVLRIGIEKAGNKITGMQKEFEANRSDVTERETKLNSENEQLRVKIKEEKESKKELQAAYKSVQEQLDNKQKQFDINTVYSQDFSEAPIKRDDSIRLKGFKAHMNEKYKYVYDENNNIDMVGIDGKRIPDPEKAGEFKSRKQIWKDEAIAQKMYSENVNKNKEVNKTISTHSVENKSNSEFARKINSRALAHGS